MLDAKKVFEAYELNGHKGLNIIKQNSFSPLGEKVLRTWGITEACALIGRSKQTIRDLEKAGKIPVPEIDIDTGRRRYTLEHINFLRDYFKTRPRKSNSSDPIVIAVTNGKGGVTKSTNAVMLSQDFALHGYKVLFIDMDSQGTGTQCFNYIPDQDLSQNETLLPFLRGEIQSLTPLIRKTYWDGLDIIPANLALYNAEFELPVKKIRLGNNFNFYDLLASGIEGLKNSYDIIILDCPPNMGMLNINAIYAANALLIPIPPDMVDFSSTIQYFGMLKDVYSRLPPKEYHFVKILISKYDLSDPSQLVTGILHQLYGDNVLVSKMPLSGAVKKAGAKMKTIFEIEQYEGSKKTLDRAQEAAHEIYLEIETLAKKVWGVEAQNKPLNRRKEAVNG